MIKNSQGNVSHLNTQILGVKMRGKYAVLTVVHEVI
jgi:hypothetical protein